MNAQENGNRPAFPSGSDEDTIDGRKFAVPYYDGLTKREAFAMAALQGLCACPSYTGDIVGLAVRLADQMLLCLNNPPPSTT